MHPHGAPSTGSIGGADVRHAGSCDDCRMQSEGAAGVARIEIRPYRPRDASGTLRIFLDAVLHVASADYSPEQIEAWADPNGRSLGSWAEAMARRDSFVATVDGTLAGFSDVNPIGEIDMLFVAPSLRGIGVATRLLAHAEATARESGAVRLRAEVSRTALDRFEACGFIVTAQQFPVKRGVALTNFVMEKSLR